MTYLVFGGQKLEADNLVWNKWKELKALIEVVELDVAKNASGTAAAGVRARKGLRKMKDVSSELVKLMVTIDNEKKSSRSTKEKKPKND